MQHVLIVEDDTDAREFLEGLITKLGAAPLACSMAEQVDSLLEEHEPNLAILDIRLPKEHGISLAWRLRQTYPELPIIVASAVLPSWDDEDIRDCGVDCMLEKPYDLTLLRKTIKTFLREGRRGERVSHE